MTDKELVLGIDTSNYKTSLAIVSRDEIITDERKFLTVKEGERGLRQSEALFQHVNNLPELFEKTGSSYKNNICGVAYSGTPRSVEGSYMPCFLAGKSFAKSISALLGIPEFEFSHQEGHIEAVRWGSGIKSDSDFLACHFSGGTCEVLQVKQNQPIEILGGTRDISFGQVLDRAGVNLGFSFPCGEEMDSIAFAAEKSSCILTPIKVKEGMINLSGIDTQITNSIAKDKSLQVCGQERNQLIREIFDRIADSIIKMLVYSAESAGIPDILMSGGVSSSRYLRKRILEGTDKLNIIFDDRNLSSDNAVGVALLGARALWD